MHTQFYEPFLCVISYMKIHYDVLLSCEAGMGRDTYPLLRLIVGCLSSLVPHPCSYTAKHTVQRRGFST